MVHGEVYHRHVDWRKAHPSPHNLRPTAPRIKPCARPVTAPRPRAYVAPTADDRAKGFTSGWHSHNEPGFNVYHRHGPGEHPH